ncbi:MAG: AI-2E family transporter [Candidatus Dojkabacteria bacterium]
MAKIYSVKSGNVTEERNEKKREVLVNSFSNSRGNRTVTFDLSLKTVLLLLFVLAIVFLGKEILSILLFLFLGFVFMSSLRPIVLWFEKKHIKRAWAIFLAYFLFLILTVGLFSLVFVPFISQLSELVRLLPELSNNALLSLKDFSIGSYKLDFESVSPYIYDLVKSLPTMDNFKNVAGFLSGFVGVFGLLITSIIFSIYLISERDSFFDILLIRIVSDQKRERVKRLVTDVERKLGGWVLGQATVSSLVSLFAVIVLSILQVPFAIPLALFIGLSCLIPQFGAAFGSLIVGIITLITAGPLSTVIFLALFFIYQQLENTIIIPKVMANAVGLQPILVMLGVIIFLIFFGPVGGLIAVPSLVILKILYEFYIDLQKLKAKGIV